MIYKPLALACTGAFSGDGKAIRAVSNNVAIHTTGGVRMDGIGEAPGSVLTSDATGNATWQAPAATNFWKKSVNTLSTLNVTDSVVLGNTNSAGYAQLSVVSPGTAIHANSYSETGFAIKAVGRGLTKLTTGLRATVFGEDYTGLNTTPIGNGSYGILGTSLDGSAVGAFAVEGNGVTAVSQNGIAVSAQVSGFNSGSVRTAVKANGDCADCTGLDISGNIKVSGAYQPAFQTPALGSPNAAVALSYLGAAATDILYVTPVNNAAPATFPSFTLLWNGANWQII